MGQTRKNRIFALSLRRTGWRNSVTKAESAAGGGICAGARCAARSRGRAEAPSGFVRAEAPGNVRTRAARGAGLERRVGVLDRDEVIAAVDPVLFQELRKSRYIFRLSYEVRLVRVAS